MPGRRREGRDAYPARGWLAVTAMLSSVHTKNLRVGMYVVLPFGWWEHPFARSRFRIDSEDLLRKVRDFHDGEVLVDLRKSSLAAEEGPELAQELVLSEGVAGTAERIVACLSDPDLPPLARAETIYQHAHEMLQGIFEEPSAENIEHAKAAIGEIVDAIVADFDIAGTLISVSKHDQDTFTHCVNVGVYGIALASQLYPRSSPGHLRELGAGLFLHDVGKTRVDRAILAKRGRLTPEERAIIRQHPLYGVEVLRKAGAATEECRLMALQHHERVDGGGYPHGLRGSQVHEFARLCSLVDVFDALVSERPYKPAMTPYQALAVMRDEMLDHFGRPLFERFVRMFALKQKRAA